MDISAFQEFKLQMMTLTGLSRDALHIHAGMLCMMIYCAISRQRLGQWGPWIAVMIMACAAEGLDFWDDINAYGSWRWKRSVHDIINTMVWPSLLLLVGRFMPSLLAGSKR